jgi:hypothetical protein
MVYTEKEKMWRIEYRKRPSTKVKQKEYMQKYNTKPEVRQKRREYLKKYMESYWKKNPDKYLEHKKKIALANRLKDELNDVINKND